MELTIVGAFYSACIFLGGAFLSALLREKGKNLATKDDFRKLQEQMIESTHSIESIKTAISHADWLAREWDGLRIKHIEEIPNAIDECELYLNELMESNRAGLRGVEKRIAPYSRLEVIGIVYLPELRDTLCQIAQLYMSLTRDWVSAFHSHDPSDSRSLEQRLYDAETAYVGDGMRYAELQSTKNYLIEEMPKLVKSIIVGKTEIAS